MGSLGRVWIRARVLGFGHSWCPTFVAASLLLLLFDSLSSGDIPAGLTPLAMTQTTVAVASTTRHCSPSSGFSSAPEVDAGPSFFAVVDRYCRRRLPSPPPSLSCSGWVSGVRVWGVKEKDEEDRGREGGNRRGVGHGSGSREGTPPLCYLFFFLQLQLSSF